MCRIISLSGKLEQGAITTALRKFGTLAENGAVPQSTPPGHKDGWGFVAYHGTKIVFYEKQPRAASADPAFTNATSQIAASKPSLVVGHLRKASVGSLKVENTHPFVVDNWTFCHNGSIGGKDDMAGLPLDANWTEKRMGDTDSETFFLYLLELLGGSTDPIKVQEKLREVIHFVRDTRDYMAINGVLTNGNTLIAVREVNENNAFVKAEDLCNCYYTLFIGTSKDQKLSIICSQKLDIAGISWKKIPNHTIAIINLATGKISEVLI